MSALTADTLELIARLRRQMIDREMQLLEQLVTAMRAENISDDTAARVLNRIAVGVPDPDGVTTPPSESMMQRARRAAETPLRRPQ